MAADESCPPDNPFTTFWSEMVRCMMPGSAAAPATPSHDAMKHMQQLFLDTMAAQADQFLRSEAFLTLMRQSLDNSLAWQKALNDLLRRNLSAAQIPSRADADHMVILVRGMEDRILEKLEGITARVDRLEERFDRRKPGEESKHRPAKKSARP